MVKKSSKHSLQFSDLAPGLLQCFLHDVVIVTCEWILAVAGIKSTELFNCKILVFVICGALSNCTEYDSLHLTFNMDQNLQF